MFGTHLAHIPEAFYIASERRYKPNVRERASLTHFQQTAVEIYGNKSTSHLWNLCDTCSRVNVTNGHAFAFSGDREIGKVPSFAPLRILRVYAHEAQIKTSSRAKLFADLLFKYISMKRYPVLCGYMTMRSWLNNKINNLINSQKGIRWDQNLNLKNK